MLRWAGAASLCLAILASVMSVICALYEPHYSGEANSSHPGFNTWYWHFLDEGRLFLWLIGVVMGAVSWRPGRRTSLYALAVSLIHLAFFINDMKNGFPDF